MTDLDEFRENWKVELGLKENEKLNQGKIAQILLELKYLSIDKQINLLYLFDNNSVIYLSLK